MCFSTPFEYAFQHHFNRCYTAIFWFFLALLFAGLCVYYFTRCHFPSVFASVIYRCLSVVVADVNVVIVNAVDGTMLLLPMYVLLILVVLFGQFLALLLPVQFSRCLN